MCSSSVEQQKEEAFYRAVIPYPAALSMKMFMTAVCTDGMHEDLVINDCISPSYYLYLVGRVVVILLLAVQ